MRKAVGFVMLVIFGVFVCALFYGFGKATDKPSNVSQSSSVKVESKPVVKKTFTVDDYNSLTVGDALTGQGGVNMNDVTNDYAKSGFESDTDISGMKMKTITFKAHGDVGANVSLSFIGQQDGSYLLSAKSAIGLK